MCWGEKKIFLKMISLEILLENKTFHDTNAHLFFFLYKYFNCFILPEISLSPHISITNGYASC